MNPLYFKSGKYNNNNKKKVLYLQDAESRGLPVLSSQGGPPLFCSIAGQGLIENIKYKCFWGQITVQNRKLVCIQWGSTYLYLGLGPYGVQLRSITVPINCLISFVYASSYGGFPCLIAEPTRGGFLACKCCVCNVLTFFPQKWCCCRVE